MLYLVLEESLILEEDKVYIGLMIIITIAAILLKKGIGYSFFIDLLSSLVKPFYNNCIVHCRKMFEKISFKNTVKTSWWAKKTCTIMWSLFKKIIIFLHCPVHVYN